MHFPTTLVTALSCAILVAGEAGHPTVTAAPVSHKVLAHSEFVHEEMFKRSMQLMEREDLHWCYGRHSICDATTDIYDECSNKSLDEYFQCICLSGWVSAQQACDWCDQYYGGTPADLWSMNTEECSSHSVTVAPIPSSVQAQIASYNATQTNPPADLGVNTGGGAKPSSAASSTVLTGAAPSSTAEENTASSKTSASGLGVPRPSSQASSSTFTLNGGAGSLLPTPTLPPLVSNNGLPSPTSTLRSGDGPSAGGSGGGASGLNTVNAVLFSAMAFGGAMIVVGMW